MDGFVAPIAHAWFHQNSIISTPDNGLLYCSRYDAVYIPPMEINILPKTVMMNCFAEIKSIACAPDWSDKRLFATLDGQNILYIWDLDLRQRINGHRGHTPTTRKEQNFYNATSAICFSTHGKVLSCDFSDLVVYCLLADTYKVSLDFFRKKTVVTLLPSPVDRDVFIAGMKDGLIQIFSIKTMSIMHALRGHDREIVSIDFMSIPVTKKNEWRREKQDSEQNNDGSAQKTNLDRPKKQARKKPVPVADTSDFLDIYAFNDSQVEFGTIVDRDTQEDAFRDQFREKAKTVEGFNFLEACENLKEDILKAANRREEDEEDDDTEEHNESSRMNPEEFNTDDENELDDCEKLRDYVVVDNEGRNAEEMLNESYDEVEHKLFLVSSSRENTLWFWDYETGLPVHKVIMPSESNARLCDTVFPCVVWLDQRRVVVNNNNGNVVEWNVDVTFKNDQTQIETKVRKSSYHVEKIIHIIRANGITKAGRDGPYLWCSSINRKLTCFNVADADDPRVALDFGFLNPQNRCLLENPLESMVIAIGCFAPRIEKINLASLQYHTIPFMPVVHKISGKVMILDWHPEDEDKLAFGTNEGRIGVINTSNWKNVPVVLKPFINKDIYSLKWCYLTDDKQQRRLVLMACSKNEFAYFYMTGSQKHEPIRCALFGAVSSISADNNLCFVGTQDGTVHVADLDQNLKQLYKKRIAKRYISSLEYKQGYLAVGANDNIIRVIDFTNGINDEVDQNCVLLEGHTDGICKLRWNRGPTMRLVSCSFDCTIRVWDAISSTCLKIYHSTSPVFAAIFSPLDENLILFVGKHCSLSCFDYTQGGTETQNVQVNNLKIKFAAPEVLPTTDTKTKNKKTKKQPKPVTGPRNTENASDDVECLTNQVNKVSLEECSVPQRQTNLSTTFQLTHREANKTKDVLECIIKLLHTVEPEPDEIELKREEDDSDNDSLDEKYYDERETEQSKTIQPKSEEGMAKDDNETETGKIFYNEKLFSTEEKLKQLIQEEVDFHAITDTSSIGLFMLPQLLHKLKETLLENISKKKLTPQMLALAPYVSHIFWRKCCQAYAYQLIENKQSLAAVPYFLASHSIDATIEELCDAKYYREAWVICRLQKMPHDPILEKVAGKWAQHLDATGNYEAAALVWTGVKKYEAAITMLEKRREMSEDIQHTIDELNVKLKDATSSVKQNC